MSEIDTREDIKGRKKQQNRIVSVVTIEEEDPSFSFVMKRKSYSFVLSTWKKRIKTHVVTG